MAETTFPGQRNSAVLDSENTGQAKARNKSRIWFFYDVSILMMFIIVLFAYDSDDVVTVKALLAVGLLAVCLYPVAHYLTEKITQTPVLPILCFAYAWQFALPVFTREPKMDTIYGEWYLDDGDVVVALLITIAGILILQMVYRALQSKRITLAVPQIPLHLNEKKAQLYCLFVLGFDLFFGKLLSLISTTAAERLSGILGVLQNQILIAIAIMGWIVYTKPHTVWQKLLLYLLVAVAVLRGFNSTMLEYMILPVVVLFMTRWIYQRRIPVLSGLAGLVILFFLSPVKKEIRNVVAENLQYTQERNSPDNTSATIPAIGFKWLDMAVDYWGETVNGRRDLQESTADAMSRTDYLHLFAYIYSLTPSPIAYQHGSSYAYLAVTFIPRAFWPEKPQANLSNNLFAVNYGISTEEGVQTSSFGPTLIGEGYMNFGIYGALFIMAVQGIIFCLLENMLGGPKSGAGGQAILIATVVFFFNGIGNSAAMMFGGIVQNVAVSCLLLWWAREKKTSAQGGNSR